MKDKLPQEVLAIFSVFEKAGYEIYVVGGAVRDLVMGTLIDDWDFTTNATPQEIQKLFADSYYDNAFGTVGIPSKEEGLKPFEITTFRHEFGYSDARRPDRVEWGKTLEGDLKRRDFTINAMAMPPSGKIIDPFGGIKDIEKKFIRAVGDPQERFSEDALRMMRAVRIAAQINFTIEDVTFRAIQENRTLIHKIAKERVRDELLKLLASTHPYEGIVLMRESGLLGEIIPELEKGFGIEQKSPGRHHVHDVGTHSLLALKFCPSSDPIVRFATLIHDIGKPTTYKKQANGVITFYNHEVAGGRIAKRIAERLRLAKRESERLYTLVRRHQFTVDEHQTDSAVRRFIKNVGLENIQDMLDLRTGDRLGGGARETSWRLEDFKKRILEVQKQPFSVRDLKISGTDIMAELHLSPGPRIGEILNTIFTEVVEKGLPNEREMLLQKIKAISAS